MSSPGRPPKDPEKKRTKPIRAFFTEKEAKDFAALAESQGIKPTQLARKILYGYIVEKKWK